MAKSKIRPTEGEFDNEEARAFFAKCYFWKQLLKLKVFDDLIINLVSKFDKDLSFYQNEWNFRTDIKSWQKENNLFNNQETKWLEFWIIHFIERKAKYPELKDDDFQLIMARDYLIYYAPKVKGLHTWLYGDYSAEKYIENQRLQALDDLKETSLASLPQRVKTFVADERAKQAKSYTNEVLAKLKEENPNLKQSVISPKYEQHFNWLFQVYFDTKQFTDVANAENVNIANVSREVNKLADLLGFSKPTHIRKGRKKGSQNNPILSKLGKN